LFSFALLLLLGYVALRLMARHKMAAFGMVWFFITLLPVCHIFPHHELLAEHYLYLPSVGFCLAAALAAERFLEPGRRSVLITGCLLAVAVLFACRIWDRNRDWSDTITLYQKTVTTAPQCARAHNNLGNALARAGRLEEAIAAYGQALAVKPAYPDVLNNLGIVYLRSGDADEAITTYMKALALTPNHTRAHYNLANAYREKGLFDQAIAEYIKALKIKPGNSSARRNLMDAQARRRALDRKISAYERALPASPADATLHNNLGELYGRKGMVEKAVFHYRQAMDIKPDYAPAYNNLAWVYATSASEANRNGREAVLLATRACELTAFQNAGMLDTLAAAYAEEGDFENAVAYQKRALAMTLGKEQAALRIRLRRYESGQPYRSY
jgi:Flp pilus assembly protein TadD